MFRLGPSSKRFNNGVKSNVGGWKLLRSLECLVDEIGGTVANPSLRAENYIELCPAKLSCMRRY